MDEPLPNSPRILGQARSAWGDGAEPATPQALDMTTDDDPLPTPPPSPHAPRNHFAPPRLDLLDIQSSPMPTAAPALADVQSPLPPPPTMAATMAPAPAPAHTPLAPATLRQERHQMPHTSVSMMSMGAASDTGSSTSRMSAYSAPAAPASHVAETPQPRSAVPVLTLEPVALTPWQQRQQQQARQAQGAAAAAGGGGGGGEAGGTAAPTTTFAVAADGGSQFKSLDFMNSLKQYLRSQKMGSRWRRLKRFPNAISGKELVDAALSYMHNSGQARFANAQRSQAAALVQRTIQRGGAFTCVAVPGKPFKDTKSRLYTLASPLSI